MLSRIPASAAVGRAALSRSCLEPSAILPSSAFRSNGHSGQRMSPSVSAPSTGRARSKHSSTQIKRLFKNHPARARVESRRQQRPPPTPVDKTYPPVFEPTFLPNGWSAPPPDSVSVPEYPFRVGRTGSKPNGAVGFLPVYSDFRINGSKKTTLIKRVTGDRGLFLQELRAALNLPEPLNNNPRDDSIRIRTGGTIEVDGNRVREVKMWLAGLGF